MNVLEMSPMTIFTKALAWASKLTIKYGDPLSDSDVSKPFRPNGWDCSWFVADCIRAITEIYDVYTKSAASQAVTGAFCTLCSDAPSLTWMQLPLLFLYDRDSTAYPQKTVHVGIALPNYAYFRMLVKGDPLSLKEVYTLDLFEASVDPPRVHPVSDWFQVTPLQDVRIIKFQGVVPPTIPDGKRFAVAPAFLDLSGLQRLTSLRP